MHIRPTYRDANPRLPAGRKYGRISRKKGRVKLWAARHIFICGAILQYLNVAKNSSEKVPKLVWRYFLKRVCNVLYNLHLNKLSVYFWKCNQARSSLILHKSLSIMDDSCFRGRIFIPVLPKNLDESWRHRVADLRAQGPHFKLGVAGSPFIETPL